VAEASAKTTLFAEAALGRAGARIQRFILERRRTAFRCLFSMPVAKFSAWTAVAIVKA
jgi:hypothetical protein